MAVTAEHDSCLQCNCEHDLHDESEATPRGRSKSCKLISSSLSDFQHEVTRVSRQNSVESVVSTETPGRQIGEGSADSNEYLNLDKDVAQSESLFIQRGSKAEELPTASAAAGLRPMLPRTTSPESSVPETPPMLSRVSTQEWWPESEYQQPHESAGQSDQTSTQVQNSVPTESVHSHAMRDELPDCGTQQPQQEAPELSDPATEIAPDGSQHQRSDESPSEHDTGGHNNSDDILLTAIPRITTPDFCDSGICDYGDHDDAAAVAAATAAQSMRSAFEAAHSLSPTCLAQQPIMFPAGFLPVVQVLQPVLIPCSFPHQLVPPLESEVPQPPSQLPKAEVGIKQHRIGTTIQTIWVASAAKLASTARNIVSPRFSIDGADFKCKLRCPGRGFKQTGGKGLMSFSCESSFGADEKAAVSYRLSIGEGAKRQQREWIEHDFAQHRTSREEEFNFLDASDGTTFTVGLEVSIERTSLRNAVHCFAQGDGSGNLTSVACAASEKSRRPDLDESSSDEFQTHSRNTVEPRSETVGYVETARARSLNQRGTGSEDNQVSKLSPKAVEFAKSSELLESEQPGHFSQESPVKVEISAFLDECDGFNSSRSASIVREPEADPVYARPHDKAVPGSRTQEEEATQRALDEANQYEADMKDCLRCAFCRSIPNEKKCACLENLNGFRQSWKNVCVRNLPNNMNTSRFRSFLQKRSFTDIDFVYVPHDFKRKAGKGFAFVNFTTVDGALKAFRELSGFGGLEAWQEEDFSSKKTIAVSWAKSDMQGRENLITFYRDSTVMHESVNPEYRPLLLKNGEVEEFPEPTKKLRPPQTSDKFK